MDGSIGTTRTRAPRSAGTAIVVNGAIGNHSVRSFVPDSSTVSDQMTVSLLSSILHPHTERARDDFPPPGSPWSHKSVPFTDRNSRARLGSSAIHSIIFARRGSYRSRAS